MKKPLPIELQTNYIVAIILLLLFLAKYNSLHANPQSKNASDSIMQLVDQCPTDNEKLKILSDFFWKYAYDSIDFVRQIGYSAFEIIKNSDDIEAKTGGYLIKSFIYKWDLKYDSAEYYFNTTLQFAKIKNNQSVLATCYYYLGEINYITGNFDSALLYFKNATKYISTIRRYDDLRITVSVISSIYEQKGWLDSALIYRTRNIDTLRAHSDTLALALATVYLSAYYKRQKNISKSVDCLRQVLEMMETYKNPEVIYMVNCAIGDYFAEQKKNYPLALTFYREVLDLSEKKLDEGLRIELYDKISAIYHEQDKDSLALQFSLKSLAIAKAKKHRHYISRTYHNLGVNYKNLGNCQLAKQCFKMSLEIGCHYCPAITFHQQMLCLGDVYLITGKSDSAFIWYSKSLELAQQSKSQKEMALSKLKIGNYFRKTGQYKKAEQYYLQSFVITEKQTNITLLKDVADTLHHFYIERNNVPLAYRYLLLSKEMSDSLVKIDKQTDLTEFAISLEFEKIKKETEVKRALANEELKRQIILRNSFIVISILLIGLGVFAFMNYRRKKRDYIALSIKNKEIERISNELHQSDEMKLRFFSNISHEFRTPLTLIINPLQKMVGTKPIGAEDREQLELMYKNAQKLLDLTNQILDLQKLDAGKLQLDLEKADIVTFCKGIISSFESLCDKKNNTLRLSTNHTSVITWFDKDKLGKILVNLLSNALKFSNNNSTIKITTLVSH